MCRREKLEQLTLVVDGLCRLYQINNLVTLYHYLLEKGESEDAAKIKAYWDYL